MLPLIIVCRPRRAATVVTVWRQGGSTGVLASLVLVPPTATACSESRQRLDEALRSWADWHAAKHPPGASSPPVELVSGSLAYNPHTMRLGGGCGDGGGAVSDGAEDGQPAVAAAAIYAWEDKPTPPAKSGAETLWFNVAYEKVCCCCLSRWVVS